MRGEKQKYSLDFKLSVIQAVENGQYSAEEVVIHAEKADIVKALRNQSIKDLFNGEIIAYYVAKTAKL